MCHDLLHLVLPLLKLKNNALEKPMQILHTAQKLPGVIRVGIPIRSFADLRIDEGEMNSAKKFPFVHARDPYPVCSAITRSTYNEQ